jgi:Acetyltransferase (GNAT) domain
MEEIDQRQCRSADGSVGGVLPLDRRLVTGRVERAANKVFEIDPLSDPRWDEMIQNHPEASVFHSKKWLRTLNAVHGYDPIAFTTSAPGIPLRNVVAFCEVRSWLTGRRLVSLPFSDHCEPLLDRTEALDDMLLYLKRHVEEHRWKYLEIRPVCGVPSARTMLERGTKYYLHRVGLRPSSEDLFRNFHKDCVQRKIRRAEREKLQYEEGTSEELLQKFYRLLVMTRRRQCLPPQPIDWFRGLIAAFGSDLKIRVASKGRTAVASILTLSHKTTVTYKYGCSNATLNNLGGTALLFWRTIQEAKEQGFEQLELGRSAVDNPGLISFKEHWGARRIAMYYWSYPLEPAGLASVWKDTVARRVITVCPDAVLEAVGRLMYKHVG